MQHLTFCVTNIVLQFREQRHSGGGRHRLKHILLPVLAQRLFTFRNGSRQVRRQRLFLFGVGHHLEHLLAIGVDGVKEFLASTTAGRQHHLVSSLQVFLVAQCSGVAITAVSLLGNGHFQLLSQGIELIAHLLHLLRSVVPLLDLLRILLHLLRKVIIYRLVHLRGVLGGALQTLLHNGEAIEHLVRDVQRQHSHQYDVHQVNHLLAW